MIHINLLPFRAARKKENIRRQVSIFLLSLIFILLALMLYHIRLNRQIGTLNSQIKTTKKQLAGYQKISKEIDGIKHKLKILNDKLKIINQLELNRKEPIRLLDKMTTAVVHKRMWFTSFGSRNQAVNIKGIALDEKTVADFMTGLEKTALFASVNLKNVQKHLIPGRNIILKKFEISCTKVSLAKPPKVPADKAKAKKK